jgi:hypothetical protein
LTEWFQKKLKENPFLGCVYRKERVADGIGEMDENFYRTHTKQGVYSSLNLRCGGDP